MISPSIALLDVVALTVAHPDRGLAQGQVGTVVEELAHNVFEVEFSDNEGRTYASLAVSPDELMVKPYQPVAADMV
jgi:pyrrolidone-carboxylate peptidase